jgi:hypothetical protein
MVVAGVDFLSANGYIADVQAVEDSGHRGHASLLLHLRGRRRHSIDQQGMRCRVLGSGGICAWLHARQVISHQVSRPNCRVVLCQVFFPINVEVPEHKPIHVLKIDVLQMSACSRHQKRKSTALIFRLYKLHNMTQSF